MSRADELRNRVRAIQQRDQTPPGSSRAEDPDRPVTPPARTGKPRVVRQTVDLTPEAHTALAAWRMDTALALDRGRLTTQEVLSTLVAVLLADDTVARRVRAKLSVDQ